MKTIFGILSHPCVFLCTLLFPMLLCVSEEGEYPRAFPAHAPELKAAPANDAAPPGMTLPGANVAPASPAARTESTDSSAAWLLRRMSVSEQAALRARASEAWPISDAFQADMDALLPALTDPAPEVRAAALRRVESHTPEEVFGYIMRTLASGTRDAVLLLDAALPYLQAMMTPLMTETLKTELETPEHRRAAAYCLGRMGVLTAADALAEYAWSENALLARACVDALYAILAPQSLPHWTQLLAHPDDYCRRTAVRALAHLGGPQAFEQLRALILQPGDAALQMEAVQALTNYPEDMLFPLLVESLAANAHTRPLALRLLRDRTGVDFGQDQAAWNQWLEEYFAPPPTPPLVPGE